MNVSRDVILDLLPVYLSGEASADTSALVEAFLKENPELASRLRDRRLEQVSAMAPLDVPPDLELKALSRTKRLIAWQRWLMGFAIALTSIAFSVRFDFNGGRLTDFRFALQDFPAEWAACLGLAAALWVGYFLLRHRLRTSAL
ncbi:MAG: anti-sigma factor family protein [Thermoanaerobaculales bacterium]